MIPELHIEDYNYPLADERIAKYPLAQRDSSKLLRYENGSVTEYVFRDLPELLPENSIMVFNDTKVVPARLHFQRDTGAHIEIFCLEPVTPNEYNLAFAQTGSCVWKCVIGNAKRWKDDMLSLYNAEAVEGAAAMDLKARLIERDGQTGLVEFTWTDESPFSRVLDICGAIPIPPYLNRETETIDKERYQTLYAHYRGSVAAPTAGLHFTEDVLGRIREKGVDTETVCLHVGAGTFLPVKSSNVSEHAMHREPFVVTKDLIKKLADKCQAEGSEDKGRVAEPASKWLNTETSDKGPTAKGRQLVAVGTTSVRTLESLYYIGVSIIENGEPSDVAQWAPYEREYPYSTKESLQAIADYLERNSLDSIVAGTRIIIVPGFKFRLVDHLVTNFHQPESTLILLVSAFVDGDWRTIYDYALAHDFRFLSYGDSSFLTRAK